MAEERRDMFEKPKEAPTAPPFKKGEETKENPEEGETSEQEAPVSEQETEEKKPEVAEDKKLTQKEFDKMYARMKAAEEKAEKAETKAQPVSDIDNILDVKIATDGLEAEEIKELQLRAKAKGASLLEAREDENFKLWQEGRKAKVEKEKALNPSTNQGEVNEEKPMSIEARLKKAQEDFKGDNDKIQEETAKILSEARFVDRQTGQIKRGMNPLKRFAK